MIYSKIQMILLTFLRLVLGYHFLFEGIDKLFSPGWSSAPFLLQSNWFLSDFFHFLAGSEILLSLVDFLNIWGQIFIGLGLILGLFSVFAAFAGALLLLIYYLAIPPFLESFLFIDRNLLEFFAFLIVALFPTSKIIGMDLLVDKYRRVDHV